MASVLIAYVGVHAFVRRAAKPQAVSCVLMRSGAHSCAAAFAGVESLHQGGDPKFSSAL